MVAPGNHDVTCRAGTGDLLCPQYLRNFSAYRHRFRMPSNESKARGVQGMWYSWQLGAVHFASVSTESDFPHAPTTPHTLIGGGAGGGFGDQLSWLKDDLAAARADPSVTWIVVVSDRFVARHAACRLLLVVCAFCSLRMLRTLRTLRTLYMLYMLYMLPALLLCVPRCSD